MAIKVMQKNKEVNGSSKEDVLGVLPEMRKKMQEKSESIKKKEPYIAKLKGEDDEPVNPIMGKSAGKGGWNEDPRSVLDYHRYRRRHNEWEEKEIAKDRAKANEYGEYKEDDKDIPQSRKASAFWRETWDTEKLEGGKFKKENEQSKAIMDEAREAIRTKKKGYDSKFESIPVDEDAPEYKAYWENRTQKGKKKMADLIKSMQK